MPLLPLPKRLAPGFRQPGVKPTVPVEIDWSNPLSRGLRAVILPLPSDVWLIITRKGAAFFTNNGLKAGVQNAAFGITGFVSSSYADTLTPTDFLDVDTYTNWAIVTGMSSGNVTGGINTIWDIGDNTNTSTNFAMQMSIDGKASLFGRGGTGGGLPSTNFPAGIDLSDGKHHQVIFSQGTTRLRGIADGVHGNWWTGTASRPSSSSNVLSIGRLGDSSPSSYWTDSRGLLEYVYLYDRDLYEDNTYKSLVRNPYQILKPATFTSWFIAGGGQIVDVSMVLGLSNDISNTGGATAQGGITLTTESGVSDGGQATGSAALALANQMGITNAGIIAIDIGVSLGLDQGLTVSGTATANTIINLDAELDQTVSALAQTIANVALSNQLDINSTTGQTVAASLTLGLQQGITSTALIVIEGSVTLGSELAATLQAEAATGGSLDLGTQLGLAVLGQATAQAGIQLDTVTSVTTVGTKIVIGLITPDNRRYIVEIDMRNFSILADDRSFKVPKP